MLKNCPVCGEFTFELFTEEFDDDGNVLLNGDGYCTNCRFKYEKRTTDNKTLKEQANRFININKKVGTYRLLD